MDLQHGSIQSELKQQLRASGLGKQETNRTPRFQLITKNKLQEIKPPAMGNQQLIEIGKAQTI